MIIAQLSDIHAAPDNTNLQRLAHALDWIDQVMPDVLVVSGDLVDDNGSEGYTHIAAQLRQRPYPALILPGNADNPEMMRATWPRQFPAENSGATGLHFVADINGVRLIGIDSTLPDSTAGSVLPHLDWLAEQLSPPEAAVPVLFLHHHVFRSGIPPIDQVMCQGAEALGALLSAHPHRPLAIACGHVHRPAAGHLAGIPAVICGSICPANPVWFGGDRVPPVHDAPAVMIHRLVQGEMVSLHVSI